MANILFATAIMVFTMLKAFFDAAMGKQKKEPTSILDLPAELQCAILSQLPGKQLLIMRGVSKHFRATIENRQNRSLVIWPGARRLRHSHDITAASLFECEDPLEMLLRILERRGLWPGYCYVRQIVRQFVLSMWIKYCPRLRELHLAGDEHDQQRLVMDLQFIAEALIQTVINTHHPRSVDIPIAIVLDIHDFFVYADHALAGSPELKEAGFTKVQLGKWYLQIVGTPSQLNRVPLGSAPSLALPEYLLTPLKYWNQDALANTFTIWCVGKMYNGVCRIRQLQHILNGVGPRLVRASPNWAYAVRTKHAYDLVVKAVVNGKVLTDVEKLAVLDELYLF